MKISFLESENKILRERLDDFNSSSLSQQNLTIPENIIQRLESILSFEIEQTIIDSQQKMMQNVSSTITDLELRDRYLSLSLLDVHNITAHLSSFLSSLDAQQKQMKSEIQTLTNSHQHDISKLNDTIIHLKNRVQSNVAFTAGILGEYSQQHTYTGTIKFPKVIYQVGGGYNPTTGIHVFTAPKAGLYLIFCTNVADDHINLLDIYKD
ncbi:uncharacterized protein LOC134236344 [Saccostrea cucullata]|uniref:uncharacterized protein LOC134236344 n=1 Tax=Saccostrea cuccullata TaxID=36930 RepID=UPI002ED67638